MSSFGNININSNYPDERKKILDGTYPTKIVLGKQRKHILGTVEFEQDREKMQRLSTGSEPSILEIDAEKLIKKYKATGKIRMMPNAQYPREIIDADIIIGKTWVQSLQKYVNTKRFEIHYSSKGAHIVPVNDYVKE